MSTLRIAHFSDTHVLALQGVGPGRFLNKRWTGAINLALNRSRHYRVEIFEALLAAVTAQAPDHTICTGDLVNLALEPEFDRVSALLASHFADDALTVVPGNHDAYCRDAVDADLFARHFGRWQPRAGAEPYPVQRVLEGAFIVGLTTALPTAVFMATGTAGGAQIAAMRAAFEQPEAKNRFRLLMLHHPLFPEPKRRLDTMRRLTDADAILDTLAELGPQRPQLVVHGHNHEFKRMALPGGQPVIQVASASRSGETHRAEFNIYVIENGALSGIERHIHDPETGHFRPCAEDGTPLAQAA